VPGGARGEGQSLGGSYTFSAGGLGSQSRTGGSGGGEDWPPNQGGGRPRHGQVASLNAWGNPSIETETPGSGTGDPSPGAERATGPPAEPQQRNRERESQAGGAREGGVLGNGFHFERLPEPRRTIMPAWSSGGSPTSRDK